MAQIHAFDYLENSAGPVPEGLCVLHGDDRYLKWMVRKAIERQYSAGDDGSMIQRWSGDTSPLPVWSEVMGDLSARSLFGPPARVGLMDGADKFVSEYRKELEAFQQGKGPAATLILEVTSWMRTTKLAKYVADTGMAIDCSLPQVTRGNKPFPDLSRLAAWLCQRAKEHHGFTLTRTGATYLIEHQPLEVGVLDQSLAKLALFVEKGEKADEELISRVVVGWQARTVFDMVEAALDGRAGDALAQLARLIQSGDEPVALFGGLAWSLRRYALAALIAEQREVTGGRVVVKDVIRAAGIWGDNIEQRLIRLGRRRALELPQRLLELDLALKGSHSAPDRSRLAIEQFLFWVAAPATAV